MANPILSKEEFEAACVRGSRYSGEVAGLGHVYWLPLMVARSTPLSCPNDLHTRGNESYPATIHVLVVDHPTPEGEKTRQDVREHLKTQEYAKERDQIKKNLIDRASSHYERLILDAANQSSRETTYIDSEFDPEFRQRRTELKANLYDFTRLVNAEELPNNTIPIEILASTEYKRYENVIGTSSWESNQGELKRGLTGYEQWVKDQSQFDPTATEAAMQPAIQGVAAGALAGMALGYMIEGNFFKISMKGFWWKAGGSAIGQLMINGKEANLIGVLADGVMPLVGSGVLGGAMEVRPLSKEEKFRLVGYNKSWGEFGIDATTSIGVNAIGGAGLSKLQPYIKSLAPIDQAIYNLSFSSWINTLNYGTAKELNNEYKTNNKQNP